MRAPSENTLMTRLRVSRDEARKIREFMKAGDRPWRALERIGKVLSGTFGVEYLDAAEGWNRPLAAYINAGDTYSTTVLYDYITDTWRVCAWGDWVEARERRGIRVR